MYATHSGSAMRATSNAGQIPHARTTRSTTMRPPSAYENVFRARSARKNSAAVAAESSRTHDAWRGSVFNMNSAAPTASATPSPRAMSNRRNAVHVGAYMQPAATSAAAAPITATIASVAERARASGAARSRFTASHPAAAPAAMASDTTLKYFTGNRNDPSTGTCALTNG